MLASVFNKSRPINHVIVGITLVLVYFLHIFRNFDSENSTTFLFQKLGLLFVLLLSLFWVNFITHKNSLSENNAYTMLFFLSFIILFPTALGNSNIIMANFFILLALRRLISLQSLIEPKQKIFDACFWIFIAAIFHFWSIGFILLVYVSIVFHVSSDYKNWLIPFIALFGVGVLLTMVSLLFNQDYLSHIIDQATISFDFLYFDNLFQRIAVFFLGLLSVLFLFPYIGSLNNKSLKKKFAGRKIILSFLIGVAIYVLSDNKNNGVFMYSFFPLAVMGTSYLENQKKDWLKELALITIVLIVIVLFVLQL